MPKEMYAASKEVLDSEFLMRLTDMLQKGMAT
jgi:hypothetical protein